MKAKSKLIDTAGTALLPLYLRRKRITAYQCPEEDDYDFVVSIKGKFIRIKLKSVNGDSEHPTVGKITERQFKKSDFVIVYLLDGEINRFYTIPMKKVPRNTGIRFSKNKKGDLKSKWTKYEGFDYLEREMKVLGWFQEN